MQGRVSWVPLEVQGGLGAEGTRFGGGESLLQGPTRKQDILAPTSIHPASTHLEAYRTYLSTNLETYRTYKPTNLHYNAPQPGGPEGAGGFLHQPALLF